MQIIKKSLWLSLILGCLSTQAFALEVLKGAEASAYVKDIKQHLLSTPYTFDILTRHHRDSMHGRFSDGILFNRGGEKFLFPRRKDGHHIIVLNSPRGREEEPVTEDSWLKKIANALSDDNTIPYVFLDDSHQEIGILYVGEGTQVTSKMNDDGLLQMEISVAGAQEDSSNTLSHHI